MAPNKALTTVTRRRLLTILVVALSLAGVVIASVPFIRSLGISEEAKNRAWGAYELGDMKPGELRKLTRAWVYRRTEQDKAELALHTGALADPNSDESRQPPSAKNAWRSEKADFFVFLPYAPLRSCGVAFVPAGAEVYEGHPEAAIIKRIPHFQEACEGRTFDQSGRLFSRPQYPQEQNLPVPEVQWLSETKVLVKGS